MNFAMLKGNRFIVSGLIFLVVFSHLICCLLIQSHHGFTGIGDRTMNGGLLSNNGRIAKHNNGVISGVSDCFLEYFISSESSSQLVKSKLIDAFILVALINPALSTADLNSISFKLLNLRSIHPSSLFALKTSFLFYH